MNSESSLVCDFCWRHCHIAPGHAGVCSVRRNEGGTLVTEGYGQIVALAVDPIEKKPLYHFFPGSPTFSFALFGCNFTCSFCQNYAISQKAYQYDRSNTQGRCMSSKDLVELALQKGCHSISYTYSEPLVWQDYMIEVALLAHQKGMQNIMVTNGSFSQEALKRLLPLIDAFNVDVKGNELFYRTVCNGELHIVLDAIDFLVKHNAHLEITTMLIESLHTQEDVANLGKILKNLGVQVWHLSRFFPRYIMQDVSATSEAYLRRMVDVASLSGIPYIYSGNSEVENATYCPSCHALLIEPRVGRSRSKNLSMPLEKGICPHCGSSVYGVFA